MTETNLQYELDHHYDPNQNEFTRNAMFIDSEGRYYYPICKIGEDDLLIDVGGADRQIPLNSRLQDKLYRIQTE